MCEGAKVCRLFICTFVLLVLVVGCSTGSWNLPSLSLFSFRGPATVKASCSYEQAWAVALASVDEFEVRQASKEDGIIATEWIGLDSKRRAGLLGRSGVNEERARFFVNLKPDRQRVTITVSQVREYFSPMGAQSQGTSWRRIPSNSDEEGRLAQRISKQLAKKRCEILQ